MKEINSVNVEVLKQAVSALNESGLLTKKVKLVGVEKEKMINAFAFAVESIVEKGDGGKVPEIASAFYNDLFADEAQVKPKAKEKKKVAGKKKETKKAEKKPDKAPAKKEKVLPNVNAYGAKEGNQTFVIDEMLIQGGFTMEEIATAAATNVKRVRTHLQARKNLFLWEVKKDGKKYYIKLPAKKAKK